MRVIKRKSNAIRDGKDRQWNLGHLTVYRIVGVVIALVLPINIITLLLVHTAVNNERKQAGQEIQNALDISTANMAQELKRVSRKLTLLGFEESDIVAYAALESPSDLERTQLLGNVSDLIKQTGQDTSLADLVYYQFPANGSIVTYGSPNIGRSAYLETINGLPETMAGSLGTSWTMLYIEETPVLLSFGSWAGKNYGMLLNLDRTLTKINLPEYGDDRHIFFVDETGTILTSDGKDFLKEAGLSFGEVTQSGSYDIYRSEVEGYCCELVEAVERRGLLARIPEMMKGLGLLAVVMAVLSIPVLLYYLNRWILLPLGRLNRAMDQIEKGDLDYRIEDDRKSLEFSQINRNFNSMMEQIKKLKIDVYEQELEKNDIRLKYLSQQIKPHFILNALNILYNYGPDEYALSQKMILCISKYFRYIVKGQAQYVYLYQEMEHIRNYLQIQGVRYPDLFFSVVKYEEELKNALIPPLLVQNLVENSIKYSLKIGNQVTILVLAGKREENPGQMCIQIADTGEGIPDEILEEIRRFQETGEPGPHLGVGIQNTIDRLKYLYTEETSIRFWKESDGQGTNIEIVLPIHFEEEGDKDREGFIG